MFGTRSFRRSVIAFYLAGAALSAQAGVSHYYGGTQTINGNAYVFVSDVTTDASGNVYIVGEFKGGTVGGTFYDGTTDFDPTAGTDNRTPQTSLYVGDAYVTKINADGSYGWTQTFGNAAGSAFADGVAVDSGGNVYLAGGYVGTMDFDPGPGTDLHTNSGPYQRFTVKLHADGSYAWMHDGLYDYSNGSGGTYYSSTKLRIDGNDDLYVIGQITPGTYDFDPTAGTDSITVSGGSAAYLSKFHADGSYVWTRVYTVQDPSDFVTISDLSFDSSGNLMVLGNFNGASSNPTVDVDPGPGSVLLSKTMTTCGVQNFVVPLTTAGGYGGWVLKMPRAYSTLALDSSNNIYLTGRSQDGDQSPFSCADYQVGGTYTASLTKIIGHTAYGWTKRFAPIPGVTTAFGVKVMVDTTDNIYVAGGSGYAGYQNASPYPAYLARFTPAGDMSWDNVFGSGGMDHAAMDKNNNIYGTNAFSVSADFDPGAGVDTKTPTGALSVYLTKFVFDTSNLAPTAYDDSFSTDQGVKYYGTLGATDPENDALTYAIVTKPKLGSVTITDTATGAFTYSPSTGKSGSDSFTFQVNDGQLNSNVATVNVTVVPAPPGTDLVMTALTAPAGGAPGKSVSVSSSVKNQGATPAGSFKIAFYLSTDSTITTADTYLGYRAVSSLASNATSTANTTLTIPAATAPGNYHIGAIADYQNTVAETDENNNTIAAPFEATASDLVVSSLTGPSTPAAPATYVTVSGTVKNQGDAASTSFYLGIYFSTDGTITTGDTFLGYVSITSLAVNASKTFSKSVKIPAGLAAGTYYLGAIADYKNTVKETDETNNTRSTPVTIYIPTPDLTVTAVSAGPTSVAQRGTLTLKGTIANIGTGKTGKTTYAGFYLSNGVTDTYLKQLSVSSTLAPAASVNLSTTYTLPVGFPAGTYTVKLVADRTGVLSEIDETNNSMSGNTVIVLP